LPNELGGIVDDIILYRIRKDVFRMVINAANHEKDVAWLRDHEDHWLEIVDETEATSMIAVQGPRAVEIVAKLSDKPDELAGGGMFDVVDCTIAGVPCFAPRSGYTGEPGFELVCANEHAVKLWNALLEAGVKPCGLGARDVLRVEAGLPLYGHELREDLSPIAAGLGWVIGKSKQFIGDEFINAAKTEGTLRKLQGVKLGSKRLTMPGMKVFLEGREIGEVSSGIFSPSLDCGVAFAFVDAWVVLGSAVDVDIRGKMEPATLVGKRFLRK
jgi:aminomethyltransferase